MHPGKTLIKATNGADVVFERIAAKSLNYFHNPVFSAPYRQPVDYMEHPQGRLARLLIRGSQRPANRDGVQRVRAMDALARIKPRQLRAVFGHYSA
jgi:hypothetical protein